jgi:hypothetical protein
LKAHRIFSNLRALKLYLQQNLKITEVTPQSPFLFQLWNGTPSACATPFSCRRKPPSPMDCMKSTLWSIRARPLPCERNDSQTMRTMRIVSGIVVSRHRAHAACRRTLLAAFLCSTVLAAAQTTTVSGVVYDPRTTAHSLPLANVLVYLSATTPAALPAGVQCLSTKNAPSGVASTFTAADGSFTLTQVPTNASYTLVIQAGKWRRQFPLTVASDPVTGLALHMPANHSQGDIPLIAISTGSVDGLECVLRDMGISDSEFSDDNGTKNPGGRIHLYVDTLGGGAAIDGATPTTSTLTENATRLSQYDMVLFACPGAQYAKSSAALTNVLHYANAGGRIFATHFNYVWLDPNAPDNSPFPAVADWNTNLSYPTPDPGIATINTSFTDGATLAQWLNLAGASYKDAQGVTHSDEVSISTLRHDFNTVIAPTQAWLTLNDSNDNNPIMQMTFNTPVGADSSAQCGRVLFNEYHVMDPGTTTGVRYSNTGLYFPNECPATSTMSAQEAMLEYALFDLSSFVQPVVIPSLALAFSPDPMIVKQGDTADTLEITTTNTSSTLSIDSSAALTLTLPAGMTATALTGSSGEWQCTLATLTCTRTTGLTANASNRILLSVTIPSYAANNLSSYTSQVTATIASPSFSSNVTASDPVIFQQQPAILWPAPSDILYGTALSATQLNATSAIAGTFAYTPETGTILTTGTYTLHTTLTPTDAVHYTASSATVPITVLNATPPITLTSSSNPAFLSNAVTFTATVRAISITPSGTIAFYDGTTLLSTTALSSGSASYTTAALTLGTHAITAVYSGDTNYHSATSAALAQQIDDFTLTVQGSNSATLDLGQCATFLLLTTPAVGTVLAGPMTFAISGMAPQTTASFAPSSLAAGITHPQSTLTITMASSFVALHTRALIALCLVLLPCAWRLRRAARRWLALAWLTLALATSLTACTFQYTPKSATVTITATSGTLSHSTTIHITVQ